MCLGLETGEVTVTVRRGTESGENDLRFCWSSYFGLVDTVSSVCVGMGETCS